MHIETPAVPGIHHLSGASLQGPFFYCKTFQSCLLKFARLASPTEVAKCAVQVIMRTVPPAVPGIHHLSGASSQGSIRLL